MRRCCRRPLRWGTVVVAAGLTGLFGLTACGQGARSGTATSSSARPPTAAHAPSSAPPGVIGLSPAGVTTRVDVPAESTEEEYYQACHAAKVWMDARPKAGGQTLLEPYLAMVQASPSGTPGSWNARWAELTPARQAAVIIAARAAAGDECG